MSFYEIVQQYQDFPFEDFFAGISAEEVHQVVAKDTLQPLDFLTLLSPEAANHLELIAEKANRLTVQYFGRTIQLFAPLYISNYCSNQCIYCGFNTSNSIKRRKLNLEEIDLEARAIAETGIQHLLMLTGEAKAVTPMEYLLEAVACLKKHFASVSIEIFPMDTDEYRQMQQAGVDGLTLFQETYNEELYKQVHLRGKKRDYRYRLDGPERGAKAGMRMVNIGALLGLGEKRSEFFFTGLHADYLDRRYIDTEISISLPRFNPADCEFQPDYPVDDRTFVQFLLALRLFQPRFGVTVSTRENARMRDNLIQLGATRFSAGVCTSVGGYSMEEDRDPPQFEITDDRSVVQVAEAISAHGYQTIYKDWDRGI
ncbi:2-iminoacetate synthase ThiH [Desulfogranum mediterraneum]|uniref:2-iminoacetate synthase ThiH n=1 Tax=Desulfogranum mediterraneum TaxID=160661 RepID=UPI0003FA4242|nr:2-iminoacetate synthase ThiH [Desulfogranum mediterraneum]